MRRIKRAKVEYISLCPRGKNKLVTLYKSDDGHDAFRLETLVKASDDFDDRGELLAVVYAPELPDSEGDIASAEVIKEMAHEYMRSGKGLDIRHNESPIAKEDAYVAENFIVAKGDERFQGWKDYQGNEVDVTGAWAQLIKIESADLRKAYREGGWDGVSMGGQALLEPVSKEDEAGLFKRFLGWLKESVGGPQEDIDMKKEELLEALEAFGAKLVKELKGDESDSTDTQETQDDTTEDETSDGDSAETVSKEDLDAKDAEIAELKDKLAKAQKKSNAPKTSDINKGEGDDFESLWALGEKIAKGE